MGTAALPKPDKQLILLGIIGLEELVVVAMFEARVDGDAIVGKRRRHAPLAQLRREFAVHGAQRGSADGQCR